MPPYDPETRRLNPIVDRYVTTDLPLLDIARLAPTRSHPLVKALVLMQESLTGNRLAYSSGAADIVHRDRNRAWDSFLRIVEGVYERTIRVSVD